MKRLAFICLLIGLAVCFATPLDAHHSFSGEFDANQPIKVKGTLAKIQWTNPHVWYYVEVKNDDGTITTWGFSGGAPGQLQRRGTTKNLLRLGATIVVEGFRARDGSNNAFGSRVIYEDGQSVFTSNAQDRQAAP